METLDRFASQNLGRIWVEFKYPIPVLNMPDEQTEQKFKVNPGYILGQLSKALTTGSTHDDAEVRAKADKKVDRWISVITGMLTGKLAIGSRTPVKDAPAWVTLEVTAGGFATGKFTAGLELQDHERQLLKTIELEKGSSQRAAINAYYLTEQGLQTLQSLLKDGNYVVNVPEESALLVVAWLIQHGEPEAAKAILDEIAPFMDQLRFYPAPAVHNKLADTECGDRLVVLQPLAQTCRIIGKLATPPALLREREAVTVYLPLYDRAVSLFVETIVGDWPCQQFADDWKSRAQNLLDDYAKARKEHKLCQRNERHRRNFTQLRGFLQHCIKNPKSLTGKEVGRIRCILKGIEAKRGLPGNDRAVKLRERQVQIVSRPTTAEVAAVLEARLTDAIAAGRDHLMEVEDVAQPVSTHEAVKFKVPSGTPMPASLRFKLLRSVKSTIDSLLQQKIIVSAEQLAVVLPQLTAAVQSAVIEDAQLSEVYSRTYEAFRKRRSLLLVNLQHQVKFTELPWIGVLSKFEDRRRITETARGVLRDVLKATLITFPHQILPNKLLQEVAALSESCGLKIPIVDELAADIFMGTFSAKYLDASKRAAELLPGSLYATYYDLPINQILSIDDLKKSAHGVTTSESFAKLCVERSGAKLRSSVAANGSIIEQEQILTTHNLAVLFRELQLKTVLDEHLLDMAQSCFVWICERQQINFGGDWHAKYIMVKNTAYAWRQMIFFASMLPPDAVPLFFSFLDEHLGKQRPEFRQRFGPAVEGLKRARDGRRPDRLFLGWSTEKHWLLV